jgi:DNA-binding transcriptional regulator PaaX
LNKWLLLVYKIPREPSVHRVSIWRKLKQLGAILLHDAVWVLPARPQTREHFQWLASEITELGGEASIFVSELDGEAGCAALVKAFSVKADESYKGIIGELNKNADLESLARAYQQALAQDYFQSKLAGKARRALLAKGEPSS